MKLEAPPGFEPGMEVLQTDRTYENGPEFDSFRPVFSCSPLDGVGCHETGYRCGLITI